MIAGIILGAGEGKRIGKSKLSLPLGNKKVVEWVLQSAGQSDLGRIILVIRPNDKAMLEIGKKWGAEIVINPDFRKGMSTSIQEALKKIDSQDVEGFFLILGDQPFITPSIINQLVTSFSPGNSEIVVPYYKERRGNPVLFDISWKEELMAITGDVGGRVLIKAHPEKVKKVKVSDEAIILDIDGEEDYLKAKKRFSLLKQED
ncbi:MAG: nucleotidyltransferase family protein [Candidatus Caldatribacteriota bacterium]|nr:nucleotidyltransferase family protein [Candidatus Caldatribacteriota bacterium]